MPLFSSILSISCSLQYKIRDINAVLTRNILVENVIFFDDIVYDLLGGFVDDQYFPLHNCLVKLGYPDFPTYVSPGYGLYGLQDDCINHQLHVLDQGLVRSLSRCS